MVGWIGFRNQSSVNERTRAAAEEGEWWVDGKQTIKERRNSRCSLWRGVERSDGRQKEDEVWRWIGLWMKDNTSMGFSFSSIHCARPKTISIGEYRSSSRLPLPCSLHHRHQRQWTRFKYTLRGCQKRIQRLFSSTNSACFAFPSVRGGNLFMWTSSPRPNQIHYFTILSYPPNAVLVVLSCPAAAAAADEGIIYSVCVCLLIHLCNICP